MRVPACSYNFPSVFFLSKHRWPQTILQHRISNKEWDVVHAEQQQMERFQAAKVMEVAVQEVATG